MTFEFHRFHFRFRALDAIHFPVGGTTNLVRGMFGALLRRTAPADAYLRLFEPGAALGASPSGFADWPRPFVIRAAHLDGVDIDVAGSFFFDIHCFDVRQPALAHFRAALAELASTGIGPGRGRAELLTAEALDLDDIPAEPDVPLAVSLVPEMGTLQRIAVRFVSPTELKIAGELATQPEFPVLLARLRDRISTLRALYGAGAFDIDFRAMGERASQVRLARCELLWEHRTRRSSRTGQEHPLSGFTGDAEYEGEIAEFLPWLRAARWVGVGRQTVWGKGDMRVLE
ncbi:MAG TPA: CRISPR system precrRNA processing endoribonuclease RAMP protein Cas6 [Bryobacteraceae bacterium]|nr:CRISPR system precrRNA processing endoribonuclease RAMP protein Cas6 [Bryobacteraceae bacterium]